MYTHLLGGALNIFIALEPIPPEKGVLWVSPRSHLKGIWPNKENETTAVGHREAVCPPSGAGAVRLGALQPGDAVCLSVPTPGPASLRVSGLRAGCAGTGSVCIARRSIRSRHHASHMPLRSAPSAPAPLPRPEPELWVVGRPQFMAESTRLASSGERVPGKMLATELAEMHARASRL